MVQTSKKQKNRLTRRYVANAFIFSRKWLCFRNLSARRSFASLENSFNSFKMIDIVRRRDRFIHGLSPSWRLLVNRTLNHVDEDTIVHFYVVLISYYICWIHDNKCIYRKYVLYLLKSLVKSNHFLS